MIVGLGLDIVHTERLARALAAHGGRFSERVFTEDELASAGLTHHRASRLAARFAAKEACMKALGLGLGQGLSFGVIEVVAGPDHSHTLRLTGAAERRSRDLGVQRIHLSMTETERVAAALVVLEGRS